MKRTTVLGLALLVVAACVVLALHRGLRITDSTTAAVPDDAQPVPAVEGSVDELSPPAPGVALAGEFA